MTYDNNPFPPEESDRHEIWEKVVKVDIDAFLAQDWEMCAGDFLEEHFIGIDAQKGNNPDNWTLTYPTLESYKNDWLRQAKAFANATYQEDKRAALFNATTLTNIEIAGDSALLHKKFDGSITKSDGEILPIRWQTLYKMKRVAGVWKISGFVGYMPNPMGTLET